MLRLRLLMLPRMLLLMLPLGAVLLMLRLRLLVLPRLSLLMLSLGVVLLLVLPLDAVEGMWMK